jgi:uncharacterized protein
MTVTSDIAFTPTVKSIQAKRGSRRGYEAMERDRGWKSTVTPELASFIAAANSFYLATANGDGQPYIQHRGGPPGFLKVIDDKTLGFADYTGNRQYITTGNLRDNPRAFIFLMDYAHRRRIKIWGRARVITGNETLLADLFSQDYKARPEQAILFTIEAWDVNCPQHIPQLFSIEQIKALVAPLRQRIAELEAEREQSSRRIS